MILMLLSGAWGKVIHEKNLKKTRDTVPLIWTYFNIMENAISAFTWKIFQQAILNKCTSLNIWSWDVL